MLASSDGLTVMDSPTFWSPSHGRGEMRGGGGVVQNMKQSEFMYVVLFCGFGFKSKIIIKLYKETAVCFPFCCSGWTFTKTQWKKCF